MGRAKQFKALKIKQIILCLILPFLALLSEQNNSLSRSIVWLLESEGEPKNLKPGK